MEFGCFRLRLPEHDGERVHEQSAEAEERDERGQMAVVKSSGISYSVSSMKSFSGVQFNSPSNEIRQSNGVIVIR